MKKLARISAILVCFVLVVPMILSAFIVHRSYAGIFLPDVYVSTVGNDDWTGSSPTYQSGNVGPKRTIINAIGFVSTDGTIHVAAGTYNESGIIHLSETMNLVGAGALTTIINGGGNGVVIQVSSQPFQRNTISGLTITGGAPHNGNPGGGIYVSLSHIVTINDCAIVNNSKGIGLVQEPGVGGGVCNDNGIVYLNRCTISGNSATVAGGGIASLSAGGGDFGKMEITNCTISGNTVTESFGVGGGLFCAINAHVDLVNDTIAFNRATGSKSFGGGYADGSVSSMYFKNCIVAYNTAWWSDYNNGYQSLGTGVHSLGNNIDSENKAISHYFNDPTDQWGVDPLLGALQNNGGQTSTHAITVSSPGFNRGTSNGAPATDQRGIARPQGIAYDIGAFELVLQTSATVQTGTGTGNATLSIPSGNISSFTASASTACGTLSGVYVPHGFFSFIINGITAGSTVTVTITLPSAVPVSTQAWKCKNGAWVNCTSILGHNDGDNVLTLALTDGGLYDADGLANGIITDPVGFAIPVKSQIDDSSAPTMVVRQPARIVTKYISVQPQVAQAGQPVTISTNVVNEGEDSGNFTAVLKVNDQIQGTKTGVLSGLTAAPVEFTVYKQQPGTYSIDINGQQASFNIIGDAGNSNDSTQDSILFIMLAAIVIIVVAAFLVVKLRRSEY